LAGFAGRYVDPACADGWIDRSDFEQFGATPRKSQLMEPGILRRKIHIDTHDVGRRTGSAKIPVDLR
jgi:hypothetical protein